MHKVFDFAIGEGPREDDLLTRRERVVELRTDEVVGDFEHRWLRRCRRRAAVRRREASFPRSRTWTQATRGRVLRAQSYAGLDFLTSKARKDRHWVQAKEERHGEGLTMVGVRRSSCRPRPPRMIVLLVSMMMTLESRKPMLLIAHERDERGPDQRIGELE